MECAYEDFTESHYRDILSEAKSYYRFTNYKEALDAVPPAILWRHDIDISPNRALALAKIERDMGISSTYFVHLHSPFYNALEEAATSKIKEILEIGHSVGLHFDPAAFSVERDTNWTEKIIWEKEIMENYYGMKIEAVSWHRPASTGWTSFDAHEVCGMVNAYSGQIMKRFAYSSDSKGYWRYEPIPSVVRSRKYDRLQVLTHPVWWQREPMSPRGRILRCIDGRGKSVLDYYDLNLGVSR